MKKVLDGEILGFSKWNLLLTFSLLTMFGILIFPSILEEWKYQAEVREYSQEKYVQEEEYLESKKIFAQAEKEIEQYQTKAKRTQVKEELEELSSRCDTRQLEVDCNESLGRVQQIREEVVKYVAEKEKAERERQKELAERKRQRELAEKREEERKTSSRLAKSKNTSDCVNLNDGKRILSAEELFFTREGRERIQNVQSYMKCLGY